MDTAEAQHHAARLDVQTFQDGLLTAHQLLSRLDDRRMCFDCFMTIHREAQHEGQRVTVGILNFAGAGMALFLEPPDREPWATFARVNLWATGHLQQAASAFHPLEVQAMRQVFPHVGNSEWYRQAQQDGQGAEAAQLAAWWAMSSLIAGVTQPYEDGEAEDMLEALITSYVAPAPMPLRFKLRSVFEEDVLPILAKLEGLPDIPGHNLSAARAWLRRAAQAERTSDFRACLDEVDAALGCRVDDLPPVTAALCALN